MEKGEKKVTIRQVHRADRALFKWLRREVGPSLRPDPITGAYPLDTKLLEVLGGSVPRVTRMLDPKEGRDNEPASRDGGGGGGHNKRTAPGDDHTANDKEVQRMRNRLENAEAEKANLKRKLSAAYGGNQGTKSPAPFAGSRDVRDGNDSRGYPKGAGKGGFNGNHKGSAKDKGGGMRSGGGDGREFPMPPELRGPNT